MKFLQKICLPFSGESPEFAGIAKADISVPVPPLIQSIIECCCGGIE
jgi:hypothetical protein